MSQKEEVCPHSSHSAYAIILGGCMSSTLCLTSHLTYACSGQRRCSETHSGGYVNGLCILTLKQGLFSAGSTNLMNLA